MYFNRLIFYNELILIYLGKNENLRIISELSNSFSVLSFDNLNRLLLSKIKCIIRYEEFENLSIDTELLLISSKLISFIFMMELLELKNFLK
jgi:hypothetical protein